MSAMPRKRPTADLRPHVAKGHFRTYAPQPSFDDRSRRCGGLISVTASILRQNVWRRMMMRYAPSFPRLVTSMVKRDGPGTGLPSHHPGKRVKAGDDDSVVVDYDCAPFVNRVLVAGSFCGREISYDCLSPFGNNGTDSSEKNCIRTIVLGDGLWIIGAKCRLTNGQLPHSRLLPGQLRLQRVTSTSVL